MMTKISPSAISNPASRTAMTAPAAASKAAALDVRALYEAHAPFVGRVLQRLTGPGPHVDELLQEVFVTAWKRASSFEGRSTERTWLYGIAANIARHHRRGLARFSFFKGKLERETAIAAAPPAPDEELTRSQDFYNVAAIAKTADFYKSVPLPEVSKIADIARSVEVTKFVEISRSAPMAEFSKMAGTQEMSKLAGLTEVARSQDITKFAEYARGQQMEMKAGDQ